MIVCLWEWINIIYQNKICVNSIQINFADIISIKVNIFKHKFMCTIVFHCSVNTINFFACPLIELCVLIKHNSVSAYCETQNSFCCKKRNFISIICHNFKVIVISNFKSLLVVKSFDCSCIIILYASDFKKIFSIRCWQIFKHCWVSTLCCKFCRNIYCCNIFYVCNNKFFICHCKNFECTCSFNKSIFCFKHNSYIVKI